MRCFLPPLSLFLAVFLFASQASAQSEVPPVASEPAPPSAPLPEAPSAADAPPVQEPQPGTATGEPVSGDAAPSVPSPEAVPALPPVQLAPEAEEDLGEGVGRIEGVVTSKDDGFPIGDAHVFVRGEPGQTTTDGEGRFTLDVSAGVHAVTVIAGHYKPEPYNDIRVRAGATVEIKIAMSSTDAALEDFLITAPYVEGGVAAAVAERRQTKVVAEVIGAEQMSRSGDSSAASALRRVTGLTVVNGKYIYIRGMGDRYSATLLNGLRVPSPEPEVRVVPLDLFPAAMLESMLVQKSYSPDMPGDFGGGVVAMRTRGYPEEFTLSVQGGLGANLNGTFREWRAADSGSYDWAGFDDGNRQLPDSIQDAQKPVKATRSVLNPDGLTQEQVDELGKDFPNRWKLGTRRTGPDGSLSVVIGNSFQLAPKLRWGFAAAGLYNHKWNYQRDTEIGLRNVDGGYRNRAEGEKLEREVLLGTMLDTGFTYLKDQKLKFTTILTRQTTEETLYLDNGWAESFNSDYRRARYRFVERQLFSQQVVGEQVVQDLNKLRIDWRYAYSKAKRDEPDRMEYVYTDLTGSGDYQLFEGGGSNLRLFSSLDDVVHDGRLDLDLPIPVWSSLEAHGKAGAAVFRQERKVDTRRFVFEPRGTPEEERRQPPEVVLAPDNIGGTGGILFEERTLTTDPYEGEVSNIAGYASLDLPIVEQLDLTGGVRLEKFDIKATTVESEGKIDTLDYLPSAGVTWRFIESWQARATFAQTVNRPDLRELAPSQFDDVETGVSKKGNPDLKPATLRHYDARVEWYLSGDESISLGGFYKTFDDPIEPQLQYAGLTLQTWANAKGGYNAGGEVEGRKRLNFIHKALSDFFLSSNFALIKSEVRLNAGGAETHKKRPLAGQSPWVLNVQLGYEGAANGLSASLLYNIAGERIEAVGIEGLDDVKEQPFHQLDLVVSKELEHGFRLGLRGKNLLNAARTSKQGDYIYRRYDPGTELTLNVSWNL